MSTYPLSYYAKFDCIVLEDVVLKRVLENDVGTGQRLQLLIGGRLGLKKNG